MKIPLTKGHFAVVDENVDAKLVDLYWYAQQCPHTIYARSRLGYLHRIIIGAKPGEIVDHINGDGLDNRRSNLRLVTPQQNIANRNANNIRKNSEHKGVVKTPKGNWLAQVKNNGKYIYLGTYRDKIDAAIAYDFGAISLWGQYARTNFPVRLLELIDVNRLEAVVRWPKKGA